MFSYIKFMLVFFCFLQPQGKQLQHQVKKQQLFHKVRLQKKQWEVEENTI